MPQISKRFRVAREGSTTDGRKITRQMIADAAATFNSETHGVRLNCEHIKGMSPDSQFGSYGDVTAVETAEEDFDVGGRKQKRMALYATITPLDNLIELNRKKQKLFTSIHLIPDWNETGKWGLDSIAVTDDPASFSTEALEFSSKSGLYDARKTDQNGVLVEAEEVSFEFSDGTGGPTTAESAVASFFSGLSDKIAGIGKPAPETPAQPTTPSTPTQEGGAPDAGDPAAMVAAAFKPMADAMQSGLTEIAKRQDASDAKFTALKTQLESEPDNRRYTKRPPASGRKSGELVY